MDPVVRSGGVAIAALCELSVARFGGAGAAAIVGRKRPIAVLARRGGATFAFEPSGAPIPLEAFDRRHPGERAAFERVVSESEDR